MLTRLRWSAFGLRGRIVGVVLVTTVATLLVASVGLLPRLESSLRKASETTLKTALFPPAHKKSAKTHPDSYLVKLERVPYGLTAELAYRSLSAIDPKAAQSARSAQNALDTTLNNLHDYLGASDVILIGYIDPSGSGKALAASEVSPQFRADAVRSAPAAFLGSGKTVYHLETINHVQYWRALVPLVPVRKHDAVVAVYKAINEIPDAVSAVRDAFELAAGAGLLLTLLLAIPLTGTLVRRLQLLRQAALRVAVAGAGVEFPVDRARDEVGDLARSFAIMQRRLRHQEEARRAFVATASHELRTPLASLDGMLELLAEGLRDEDPDIADAQDLLERARAQSRRLGRLAADLLDLSRIDADVALRSEPVELGELARAVLAEFELALSERAIGGVLHEAGGPVWALGDPGSVARILRILIDNALRVAPAGSDIVVSLTAEPVPTLSVSDRGPGVAVEERALIFERFKRGRDTGGQAGFGLGLAIGRELAERMGGALVLANSTAPGATFTLTLPTAQAPLGERTPSAAGV